MAAQKKRLFTGLQPSGQLHIGNYLGALKPFLDICQDYDTMLMVADYHALTSLKNPQVLQENIVQIVGDYIALGMDPSKTIIFKQSDVLEHMELAWIFECLVTVPFLMQAHAYKDKAGKYIDANAGLFNYPMLMAADILLYDPDLVPVGQDQRQHIEYTREAAAKFNTAYGQTFKEPKEHIMADVGTIPGTDGEKMSKSKGNTIPLFGSEEEIRSAVMSIATDSTPLGSPLDTETDTVFALHRHFSSNLSDLEKRYNDGSIGYKESKELLVQEILTTLKSARERRSSISREDIVTVLKEGGEKAQARAEAKMIDVRRKVGVSIS